MHKQVIVATTMVALSLFNMSASLAAVGDRAKCYDKVIAVCNEGEHAQSCAKTAMDACDKEHKALLVDPSKTLLLGPASAPATRQ